MANFNAVKEMAVDEVIVEANSGVNITDNNFNWGDHIVKKQSGAMQTLGMLKRNLHSVPTKVKLIAYKACVDLGWSLLLRCGIRLLTNTYRCLKWCKTRWCVS